MTSPDEIALLIEVSNGGADALVGDWLLCKGCSSVQFVHHANCYCMFSLGRSGFVTRF